MFLYLLIGITLVGLISHFRRKSRNAMIEDDQLSRSPAYLKRQYKSFFDLSVEIYRGGVDKKRQKRRFSEALTNCTRYAVAQRELYSLPLDDEKRLEVRREIRAQIIEAAGREVSI